MLQSALAFQSSTDRGTRQENVDTLYANWQSAKAQATLAEESYRRGEYLYQEGVISRQRRDEMRAAKRVFCPNCPCSTAAVSKSPAWSH